MSSADRASFQSRFCLLGFVLGGLLACGGSGESDNIQARAGSSAAILENRSSWTGIEEVFSVGDSSQFGTIDAVQEVAGRRIAVLDAMYGQVTLLSPEGRTLSRLGRRGAGPGEFFAGVDLETDHRGNILVLDRGNMRVTVLRLFGDSLALHREFSLRFTPGDMCVIQRRVFVLGSFEGNLIHEIDSLGTVMRSFGARRVRDPYKEALSSFGRIACSEPRKAIVVAPRTLKEIRLFSLDGLVIREDSIPGYSEILYVMKGRAVHPTTPTSGYWHELASLNWLDAGTVFLQLERKPVAAGGYLESRRLRPDAGWVDRGPSWPKVLRVVGERVYTVHHIPHPVLKVFNVR